MVGNWPVSLVCWVKDSLAEFSEQAVCLEVSIYERLMQRMHHGIVQGIF